MCGVRDDPRGVPLSQAQGEGVPGEGGEEGEGGHSKLLREILPRGEVPLHHGEYQWVTTFQ